MTNDDIDFHFVQKNKQLDLKKDAKARQKVINGH